MNAYEEVKTVTENDVINIFDQFDKDSNGQISFDELLFMIAELYPLNSLGVFSDWKPIKCQIKMNINHEHSKVLNGGQ